MEQEIIALLRRYAKSFQPEILEMRRKVLMDECNAKEIESRTNEINKELNDIQVSILYLENRFK